MKFVDEAEIRVIAGKGGHGCLSFLREKFRPKGGPDGGNGGDGGSIYMQGRSGLNTLADFRFVRQYKAKNGESGAGKEKSGKSGEDLYIDVPLGTIVTDAETGETIGDITREDQALLVARGGRRGLGNATFKSSTNRAPRRTTMGKPGDERVLKLELKVLADVGLLGLPNAGKSTFLSAVSQARPKIADYPVLQQWLDAPHILLGNIQKLGHQDEDAQQLHDLLLSVGVIPSSERHMLVFDTISTMWSIGKAAQK